MSGFHLDPSKFLVCLNGIAISCNPTIAQFSNDRNTFVSMEMLGIFTNGIGFGALIYFYSINRTYISVKICSILAM